MSAREKVSWAQAATRQMDNHLNPAIDRLLQALGPSNGAAIYPDPQRVAAAMLDMEAALKQARDIYRATPWPTLADYDNI